MCFWGSKQPTRRGSHGHATWLSVLSINKPWQLPGRFTSAYSAETPVASTWILTILDRGQVLSQCPHRVGNWEFPRSSLGLLYPTLCSNPKRSDLNNRNVLFHSSAGQQSKTKILTKLLPGFSPWLADGHLHVHTHMAFIPYACLSLNSPFF